MTAKTLLIVAHAPSDNTHTLLQAAVAGANDPSIKGVQVAHHSPFNVTAEMVMGADALLLGTPENLGYMSGALKDFFDRIYYPCLQVTQGKPFGYFIRAGHDGTGTQRAIDTITTGLRWRLVADPIICRGNYSKDFSSRCQELAMTLAVGLESGIF